MEVIYHYTSGSHLEKILESGKLIVSEWERKNKIKPPAFWFSKNPIWEATATKMVVCPNGQTKKLSKEEQHKEFGLYRFVIPFVKEKFCSWQKYKHKCNISSPMCDHMEKEGIRQGARPGQWFAVFENISLKDCLRCEVWDGVAWRLHTDFTSEIPLKKKMEIRQLSPEF